MRLTVTSFIALLTLAALPLPSQAADQFALSDDDGTYKTVAVSSADECNALCKKESDVCRGSLLFTETTTIGTKVSTTMQCRLNNGLSSTSPFEIQKPEALDYTLAVKELNAYRASKGLSPVKLNKKLNLASETHAKDLAKHGFLSHTGSDGSSFGDRAQRKGYYFTTLAENAAAGQESWDRVFQGWKDSDGHNKNLLAKGVTDFGIALVFEPTTKYSYYWAMLVGSPMPEFDHATSAMTIEQKAMYEAQD